MAGIVGMGTTFNLPNFTGDLFSISPEDTPLLASIGGLTGGREAVDKTFGWQFYDLRAADATRQKVEGANAPAAEERVRAEAENVLEIHMEAVEVSYTRQAVANRGGYSSTARGTSPIADEMRWQMDQQLKQVARDVELSFIVGTYAKPADNSAPRKTRGLLQAITTNVIDLAATDPTPDDIGNLFQVAYQNGGLLEGETRTLLTTPALARHFTKIFLTDRGIYVPPNTANVGGVKLTRIQTDFGDANIMISRFMPAGVAAAVSLEQLAPRFLLIPGKGHFFWEPLAKVGAADKSMLYGEIGLEYGNERAHAKIINATTDYDAV